jgi:hypothetical protein
MRLSQLELTWLMTSSLNIAVRIRSAFTALDVIPCLASSSAYCRVHEESIRYHSAALAIRRLSCMNQWACLLH